MRAMALTPEERESKRLLAEARAVHRDAERERARVRGLAARLARKMRHALTTARAQLDIDRAAVDSKIAKLNETQTAFHTEAAADRERRRDAWAELESRQKRLAAEWEETN